MADGHFDSKSIGLRAQKKFLSKMANKKVAKVFIDETSGRLLDYLYKISKDYADKKTAEKVMKDLIKVVIKIGVLYRNDQFSTDEILLAEAFKKKFRTVGMTIVSFYEVDFTFDKNFLHSSLTECCQILHKLIGTHLTEKSHGRVDNVFGFYRDPNFLEALFRTDSKYREPMRVIVSDLNKMMEDGTL